MMTSAEVFEIIKKQDNFREKLGIVIADGINEDDNTYYDIGKYLVDVIETHPDQIDLIDNVVSALCGYGFESLLDKMTE